MHGLECLLIADDLTGACDAAVQFARHGRRTVTSLGFDAPAAGVQVLAVSTDTRDLHPAGIPAVIRRLADSLPARDVDVIFKKIDSTLRGHAGCEIAAALETFGCDAAVIAPALPPLGRVVERGFLRVTADPAFRPIELSARLESQGAGRCTPVAASAVAAALISGARFLSVDAVCVQDLAAIAEAGLASGRRILWAGSAGLAEALAGALSSPAPPLPPVTKGSAGVLFCIGSDHPVTLAQQHRLMEVRRSVLVGPDMAAGGCMAAVLARGEHIVLRLLRGRVAPAEVRQFLAGSQPSALVLSGGDTASLVCHALGTVAIELREEIAAGIPVGILSGGILDRLPVVTKSGGFGAVDDLIKVADYFHA